MSEHDRPHAHMHQPMHRVPTGNGNGKAPAHDHDHTPHAGGSNPESKDYARANKEHFDKHDASIVNEQTVELARRAAQAILDRYPFDEDSTSLMDFACNVGLLSRELAAHTKLLVGVDISQTPVDIFNEHVSNQGIPPEEMRAVCADLKGEEGELDGLEFDVITCSAAYHHFDDIQKITQILTFFLKPGGTLLVVDVTPNNHSHADGSSSSSSSSAPSSSSTTQAEGTTFFPQHYGHVVAHLDGISEEKIKEAYDAAGLCCFTFDRVSALRLHGKEGMLFVAKGKKPLRASA